MASDGPAQDAGKPESPDGPRISGAARDTADAMLKAGASVARSFAEAVSGRPQPLVPGEPPLASLVRHASSGVAGVAWIMITAARSVANEDPARSVASDEAARTGGAGTAPVAQAAPPEPPPGPVVAPGSTLRIPLSVDNPGDSDMAGLQPRVLAATLDGTEVQPPKVRFQPKKLSIAPKDFEKLVVLIDMPADAPEGRWRLAFSLDGSADAPAEIAFRVAKG
jgi:hypothetical protein